MKSASDLTEEQKTTVHSWAENGDGLQEIQKRLAEEFGLSFTFMETRFLAGDLDLKIKSEVKVEPKEEEPKEEEPKEEEPEDEIPPEVAVDAFDEEAVVGPDDTPAGPAPVVTVDQLTIPGTIISGKVTFAGGNDASWSIDQLGRLSLNPDNPEYRPSEQEVIAFQTELQEVARKQGL